MLTGSATVFFAYIGFDSVASTAEEVIELFYKVEMLLKREVTLELMGTFEFCIER